MPVRAFPRRRAPVAHRPSSRVASARGACAVLARVTLAGVAGVTALGCGSDARPRTPAGRAAAVAAGGGPGEWYAGGATCAGRPAFRIREAFPGLFVLRQPACTHYEKPFLYLLVGRERALLLDTGAGGIDVAGPVDSLLGAWRAAHGGAPAALVVAHSHGHDDHVAGDAQFRDRPGVTLVGRDADAVHRYFGLRAASGGAATAGVATFDLGGRALEVLAIPGHEPASIAVYDRATGVLLTGDTFYPGRLYVADTAAYAASVARLAAFAAARRVTTILGAHVEQTRRPYVDYPIGTRDQPAEDAPALSRAELAALDTVVRGMRGRFVRRRLPRVTIWPS